MEDIHPRDGRIMRRVRHAFRERQIYLRSDGQVQFVTLRPWVQGTFAVAMIAGLFWFSFATVNMTFKDQIIAAKERRALQIQIAYEDRLAAMQTVVERINDRLMLDQDAYMAKVGEIHELHQELLNRHQLLAEVVKHGWAPKSEKRPGDLSGALPGVERGPTTAVSDDGTGDDPRPSTLTPRPKPGSQAGFQSSVREFRTRHEAAQPLIDLKSEVAMLQDKQQDLLDQIEQEKKSQVGRIQAVLSKLGLNPARFAAKKIADAAAEHVGGPFVSIRSVLPDDETIQEQVLRIDRHIRTLEKIREAVREMPIVKPVGPAHRITSGYGVRRDPLRKTLAVHYGLDFHGVTGDRVSAAADGTVVRAGRQAGYGNLVELRHDNGVATRYAHLSRIDVKVGQQVSRHDTIGGIGSTGRSTGPHLHYEILVSGKPVDPRRFWRVGENVLKTQKR